MRFSSLSMAHNQLLDSLDPDAVFGVDRDSAPFGIIRRPNPCQSLANFSEEAPYSQRVVVQYRSLKHDTSSLEGFINF